MVSHYFSLFVGIVCSGLGIINMQKNNLVPGGMFYLTLHGYYYFGNTFWNS